MESSYLSRIINLAGTTDPNTTSEGVVNVVRTTRLFVGSYSRANIGVILHGTEGAGA